MGSLHILPSHWCPSARERLPDGHHEPRSTCHIGDKEYLQSLICQRTHVKEVTKELDTILLAARRGIAWREENLPRPHMALTHLAPLYQHLLANAGKYKMSEGESTDESTGGACLTLHAPLRSVPKPAFLNYQN